MNQLRETFRRSNKHFGPVFRRSWFILAVLTLGCELFHQYFSYLNTQMPSPSGVNIPATLGELAVSLIELAVLTQLIPQRILELDANQPVRSFWWFAKIHTIPMTLESLRAIAMTILWTLLLVVPGIFKYIRYFFVPYVVVGDPEYQEGKVDALAESNRLIRGITLPLFVLVVALTALEAWQSTLREHFPISQAPVISALATLGFFIVNYYANIFLFVLYQVRKEHLQPKLTETSQKGGI